MVLFRKNKIRIQITWCNIHLQQKCKFPILGALKKQTIFSQFEYSPSNVKVCGAKSGQSKLQKKPRRDSLAYFSSRDILPHQIVPIRFWTIECAFRWSQYSPNINQNLLDYNNVDISTALSIGRKRCHVNYNIWLQAKWYSRFLRHFLWMPVIVHSLPNPIVSMHHNHPQLIQAAI